MLPTEVFTSTVRGLLGSSAPVFSTSFAGVIGEGIPVALMGVSAELSEEDEAESSVLDFSVFGAASRCEERSETVDEGARFAEEDDREDEPLTLRGEVLSRCPLVPFERPLLDRDVNLRPLVFVPTTSDVALPAVAEGRNLPFRDDPPDVLLP